MNAREPGFNDGMGHVWTAESDLDRLDELEDVVVPRLEAEVQRLSDALRIAEFDADVARGECDMAIASALQQLRANLVAAVVDALLTRGELACGGFEKEAAEFVRSEFGSGDRTP